MLHTESAFISIYLVRSIRTCFCGIEETVFEKFGTMSFLAGRLAATEGAFFNQHSKQAAIALKQKLNPNSTPSSSTSNPNLAPGESSSQADVLPEVLRHSLPIIPHSAAEQMQQIESAPAATSIAATINLTLNPRRAVGVKHDGGLRGAVAVEHLASVPQTSFGPKKWNIEAPQVTVVASTANSARVLTSNNADEKAAMEGLYVVTKAFAVATGLVFGGSIIAASVTTSRLGIRSADDLRTKGHEYLQPKVDRMKQRFEPLKFWAQQKAEAWRMEESQRRAIGADYAKSLGVQQPEDRKWKSQ